MISLLSKDPRVRLGLNIYKGEYRCNGSWCFTKQPRMTWSNLLPKKFFLQLTIENKTKHTKNLTAVAGQIILRGRNAMRKELLQTGKEAQSDGKRTRVRFKGITQHVKRM